MKLDPPGPFSTLTLLNYLAAATDGTLTAAGAVVQRTKRVAVTEARVTADGDRLVALATGAFYIQTPGA